ncbi:hypothetical protein [Borrelia persica]|uniref:hypothetical protein n=1 Tax=Borrelia persica TaxID=44448 RepID=UPI00046686C5|nr:hypothetical protein [Borrelia persica]
MIKKLKMVGNNSRGALLLVRQENYLVIVGNNGVIVAASNAKKAAMAVEAVTDVDILKEVIVFNELNTSLSKL